MLFAAVLVLWLEVFNCPRLGVCFDYFVAGFGWGWLLVFVCCLVFVFLACWFCCVGYSWWVCVGGLRLVVGRLVL